MLRKADYAKLDCLVGGKPFDVFYGRIQHDTFHDNYYGTSVAVRHGAGGLSRGRRTTQADGPIYKVIQDAIKEQRGQPLKMENTEGVVEQNNDFVPSILYFPGLRELMSVNDDREMTRDDTNYSWVYQYQNTDSFKGS